MGSGTNAVLLMRQALSASQAAADDPSFDAGKSQAMGLSAITTGGRMRRAGPQPVCSTMSDQSEGCSDASASIAADWFPFETKRRAVRASDPRTSHPCPVCSRSARPRMAAAARI